MSCVKNDSKSLICQYVSIDHDKKVKIMIYDDINYNNFGCKYDMLIDFIQVIISIIEIKLSLCCLT